MDYLKISADDHIDLAYLPHDTWTERVPKALRDAAPHIRRSDKGAFWMCEDRMWSEYRTTEWFARPGRSPLALDRGGVGEEGRPVNTAKRLEDMARDGVEATVMFPPIVSLNPSDPALRDAIVSGYNDWAADFGDSAPGQFFPVALLSPADPQAATAEMLRIAQDGRLKQVNFLVNDVTTEMHSEAWDVFWDTAAETGMLVSYHAGGSIQTNTMRDMQTRMQRSDHRAPIFGMGLVRPLRQPVHLRHAGATTQPSIHLRRIRHGLDALRRFADGSPIRAIVRDQKGERRSAEAAAQRGLQAAGLRHLPNRPHRLAPARFLR